MRDLEPEIVHLGPAIFRIGNRRIVEVASARIEADEGVVRSIFRIGIGEQGASVRHLGRRDQQLGAQHAADIGRQLVVIVEDPEVGIAGLGVRTLEGARDAQRDLVLDERRIHHEGGACEAVAADGGGKFDLPVEGRILRLDVDGAGHRRAAR
ncbi:MAG: hypothetical protein QHC90_27140 [Shinella sp.]|nr:hypothetical protein [Shinella sp.]